MASGLSILQQADVDIGFDVGRGMRHALKDHQKGLWSQLSEIFRLRFGSGKLQPKEYYCYRLYDDRTYSYEGKERFLGRA